MDNTFTYKDFDLSVFLNFSYGNKVFNGSIQRFLGPYLPNQNNMSRMAKRFVLIDPATGKESTNLARLAELNPKQNGGLVWNISENNKTAMTDRSSYFLEDASFLRINNITLGYTLPQSLTKKPKSAKCVFMAQSTISTHLPTTPVMTRKLLFQEAPLLPVLTTRHIRVRRVGLLVLI